MEANTTTTLGNETVTTQSAAPVVATQPQTEQKTETIVLTGESIYESMSQFGDARDYRADSSQAGKQFYTFKFRGKIFTADPKFQAAYEAGKLTKVIISSSEYDRTVDDPNKPGAKMIQKVASWNIDGWMTSDRLKEIRTAKKEQMKDDMEMKVYEIQMERISTKAAELELDDPKLKELLGAI